MKYVAILFAIMVAVVAIGFAIVTLSTDDADRSDSSAPPRPDEQMAGSTAASGTDGPNNVEFASSLENAETDGDYVRSDYSLRQREPLISTIGESEPRIAAAATMISRLHRAHGDNLSIGDVVLALKVRYLSVTLTSEEGRPSFFFPFAIRLTHHSGAHRYPEGWRVLVEHDIQLRIDVENHSRRVLGVEVDRQ